MNKLFVFVLFLLGCFYSFHFALAVFFISLFIACLPFAMSWFWFLLPIVIEGYLFCTGRSDLAWWSIVFTPFHYLAFTSNIVHAIKGIINID